MKNSVTVLQLLTGFVLSGIFFCTITFAQEPEPVVAANKSLQNETSKKVYAPNHVLEAGEILYSIQTNKDNVLGVTVVNNQVIISSAGASSELSNDNTFHVYNFDGTLINSYSQGSTTGWGFRDLAYDGTYILGSEDNTVKKIDPNTFQIVGSITNTNNTIHRGLAYDAVDNTIWSTNGSTGPVVQIDAGTGNALRTLPNPVNYAKPYGIAIDRFTSSESPYLWFAEPWIFGSFRLSKMDVIDGLIYYTIDLKAALGNPENCLSGGLEIINNHPGYPGKIIAIAIEQNTRTILFVDITGTPLPETVLLQSGLSFGGWINGALVQNNFAFVFQANNLNVLDLLNDNEKLSSLTFSAQGNNGIIINDYFYFSYPNWETTSKKKIEIVNISNKNNISNAGSFETSRIMELGIEKLVNCFTTPGNNLLFILTKESLTAGVNEKILMYNLTTPTGFIFNAELSADIKDIAANGDYLYVLLMNGNLTIYDISNNTFSQKGNVNLTDPEKISVLGNYVYTACNNLNGLKIIDVSDPQLPFEAAVFGNGLYSFYDDILITNPKAFLKTIDFDIVAVDVADPLSPVEIFNFNPGGVGNFKFSGNYLNSLFLTNIGTLFEIDYSNPNLPSVTKATSEPSIIRSNTNIGDKLYTVGDDKLLVYDIDDSGVPSFNTSIDIAKANKVFTDDNYLFICDRDNLLYIYNTSLQLLGTYNAGAPVIDLEAMNNLLCLVLNNSTTLKIVDYTNTALPVERSSFELPYTGQAVSTSSDGNTLYTASNKTTIGGNVQGYFQTIDITNPANPVLLSDNQITGGNTIYNLCAENNTLFIGGSDADGWFPLEAWDVTDPANPLLLGRTMFSFPAPLSDITYFNGYIFAALPGAGLIVSYRWDSNAKQFFPGPSIDSPEPREIRILKSSPALSSSKTLSQLSGTPPSYNYAVVNNGAKYQQQTEGSKGNKIVKIVNIPKQPDPLFADLTMGIYPLEAGLHGCTTSPAPGGPYTYIKGSTVDISATDNPPEGWYFKDWTGASGGANTTIVMDADKNVIANFVNPTLLVGGGEYRRIFCASTINKESRQVMTPVFLCANEVDGWSVTKINFKASGTGNEALDILAMKIFKGGTEIYTGQFFIDNGLIEASFNPSININPNECITLYLDYDFAALDVKTYASDEPKSFYIESESVVAKPWNYDEGKISGKAKSDSLIIGRVINSKEDIFANINDGINASSTLSGDTCFVCPGEYKEDIIMHCQFEKDVSLKSFEGRDVTFILGNGDTYILDLACRKNMGVDGFTFIGDTRVLAYNNSKINIINNSFLVKTMALGKSDSCVIDKNKLYSSGEFFIYDNAKNNTFSSNTSLGGVWVLRIREGAAYNHITKNDNFKIILEEEYLKPPSHNIINNNEIRGVSIFGGYSNEISGNEISEASHNGISIIKGMQVSLYNVIDDNIIHHNGKNGIYLGSGSSGTQLLSNKIYDNNYAGIHLHGATMSDVKKNNILRNKLHGIEVNNSDFTEIHDNIISNHQNDSTIGIFTLDSRKTRIYSNKLWRNCTGIYVFRSPSTIIGLNNINDAFCLFTGISLNNSSPEIFGNTIANNSGNGIFAENGSNPVIYSNNIFGNTEYGVNNADPNVTINASNNWWGNESGPSGSDVLGSFMTSDWLTAPVSLLVLPAQDTVYTSAGRTDSSIVYFQNLKFPDDVLDITVSDNLGWVTSNASFTSQMQDSLGTSAKIFFTIPADVNEGAVNKVVVTAQSQLETNVSVKDSFYIFVYKPLVQVMTIFPDSSTIAVGDSIQLSVTGNDQHGNTVEITPTWQATIGEISAGGIFTCSTTGTAEITATDPASGMQAKTSILVTQQEVQLAGIKIYPDSVTVKAGETIFFEARGYNQFGFPHQVQVKWTCDRDLINSDGIFTADSIAGTLTVSAEDTLTGIIATAAVLIETVVSVEDEKIIPAEFKLYQNYPNPFNPTTKIKFAIPNVGDAFHVSHVNVKLSIYNILGQEVATLVDEPKQPGVYEVYFNASNLTSRRLQTLSSGIYFYTIYAKAEDGKKDFRSVKKMLLLK